MERYYIIIFGLIIAFIALIYSTLRFFNIRFNKIEIKNLKFKYRYALPVIILIIVIIGIALLFLGSFFTLHCKVDGEEFNKSFGASTLLFSGEIGWKLTTVYWFKFLILPIFAVICVFLHKYNKKTGFVALLIFLVIAIMSIITPEAFATGYKYYLRSIGHDGAKCSLVSNDMNYSIPIIFNFVSFAITFIYLSIDIKFTTRDITEMGIMIAAAVGLNFVKVTIGPTGGSINLQLLPLFIIALRRGPFKGFMAGGIVFGLITCLTDGYGFATYPFDYLVGFGSIGILGLFSKYIFDGTNKYSIKGEIFLLIAGTLSTSVRFLGGTISSMVIYGYDFIPAADYNLVYVYLSGAFSTLVIMALLGPIKRVHNRYPIVEEVELKEE